MASDGTSTGRRWAWGGAWVVAVTIAAYTGFRMPNRFATTQYQLSLTDGFHRRILIGTLLRPVMDLTHHSYTTAAVVAFAIMLALLAWVVAACQHAPLHSQRAVGLAFLLLPTGGYLFNVVGYLDQALYLLLFAGLLCLRRGHRWPAAALLTLAVLGHENALLTVLPVFAYASLHHLGRKQAAVTGAVPVLVNVAVILLPGASAGAGPKLADEIRHTSFVPNSGVFYLFRTSILDNWRSYSVPSVLAFVAPFGIVLALTLLAIAALDPTATGARFRWPLDDMVAVAAIVAPCGLALAGVDEYRWAFLVTTNFLLVLWLRLDHTRRELSVPQLAALAGGLAVILHMPLTYFDGVSPRSLAPGSIRSFVHSVTDRSLFARPRR